MTILIEHHCTDTSHTLNNYTPPQWINQLIFGKLQKYSHLCRLPLHLNPPQWASLVVFSDFVCDREAEAERNNTMKVPWVNCFAPSGRNKQGNFMKYFSGFHLGHKIFRPMRGRVERGRRVCRRTMFMMCCWTRTAARQTVFHQSALACCCCRYSLAIALWLWCWWNSCQIVSNFRRQRPNILEQRSSRS